MLLFFLLLFLSLPRPQYSLLAPPLPPLPIDETIDSFGFNIDGSPDEAFQLDLTGESSGIPPEKEFEETTILVIPTTPERTTTATATTTQTTAPKETSSTTILATLATTPTATSPSTSATVGAPSMQPDDMETTTSQTVHTTSTHPTKGISRRIPIETDTSSHITKETTERTVTLPLETKTPTEPTPPTTTTISVETAGNKTGTTVILDSADDITVKTEKELSKVEEENTVLLKAEPTSGSSPVHIVEKEVSLESASNISPPIITSNPTSSVILRSKRPRKLGGANRRGNGRRKIVKGSDVIVTTTPAMQVVTTVAEEAQPAPQAVNPSPLVLEMRRTSEEIGNAGTMTTKSMEINSEPLLIRPVNRQRGEFRPRRLRKLGRKSKKINKNIVIIKVKPPSKMNRPMSELSINSSNSQIDDVLQEPLSTITPAPKKSLIIGSRSRKLGRKRMRKFRKDRRRLRHHNGLGLSKRRVKIE